MIDSRPPERLTRWPLLRFQPGHELEFKLLSTTWIKFATHFHERTHICLGEECLVCRYLPARHYWFLPVAVTSRPHIIELSAAAAIDLEQVARFHWGRWREGQVFVATRRSKRAPVRFAPVTDGPLLEAPKLHEWVTACMAIFGFPAMSPSESLEAYRERITPAAVTRNEALALELAGRYRKSS